MSIPPISPIDLILSQPVGNPASTQANTGVQPVSFTQMLLDGVGSASDKLIEADRLVQAAVLDTSVPLHRVTYALEEARISLELMVQFRNRLVDAAQQIMNMQV